MNPWFLAAKGKSDRKINGSVGRGQIPLTRYLTYRSHDAMRRAFYKYVAKEGEYEPIPRDWSETIYGTYFYRPACHQYKHGYPLFTYGGGQCSGAERRFFHKGDERLKEAELEAYARRARIREQERRAERIKELVDHIKARAEARWHSQMQAFADDHGVQLGRVINPLWDVERGDDLTTHIQNKVLLAAITKTITNTLKCTSPKSATSSRKPLLTSRKVSVLCGK